MGIGIDPSPILEADHSLVHEHSKAIDDSTSVRLRLADEMRAWRIRYDIGDNHPGRERPKVDREAGFGIRVKSNRRGVDHQVDIGWNSIFATPTNRFHS